MICIALTGISRKVMKDLLAHRIRTVEIRSPQNFFSLRGSKPGDRLFITESSFKDIVAGTGGLITRVNELEFITHRLVQSVHAGDYYYEEIESQAARAQLQLIGHGRARRVESFEPGEPMTLEIDEVRYCDAR